MSNQTILVDLVKHTCGECSIIFGLEENYFNHLLKSHKLFYCPNGHERYFSEKTKEEILKSELIRERSRNDKIEAELREEKLSKAAIKGNITKIKNRIHFGICPSCKKYFKNLHDHMENKHKNQMTPECKGEEIER